VECRPYAVVVERGITRFILPRRARTLLQKMGATGLIVLGTGTLVGIGFIAWQALTLGGGQFLIHGGHWIILILAVILPLPFRYGWLLLRGGQGELRVSVDGNFLRASDGLGISSENIGLSVEWEHLLLSQIDTFCIQDAEEISKPKENTELWARRLDGTKTCIMHDYPRWLFEELLVELEGFVRQAKSEAEGEG